ncbi:hypothetical protein CC1G_00783 [Coprinopsis cinerea okayama7|uniref:Uncharacterized protein n=1 Tax=Coprinopsis cinerea (strain Okayama-7 / 130 / ATCC MYA-4618 / FGSC 9003) TaxID=240176 RepID=A8N8Q8_COPC7|nr:hypothetical protein CC1G_00783 [Coprinopsis cinerea okayama7\|eukprot:XP_001831236.2 hypothetical protein CC1G_00783 [Coprinopsis cinerea okayama7\
MTHMRRVYMNPSDTHGQLQTDVTRLRKQVRDLRAQETALKARHEQQQKRAESYKKKFQNGTRRIEELEGQLEETKEALEVTRNKLRKVRKERDETMEEHVSMESVVEEMEDTVSRLRRERNETRDALTAAKADGVVKKRLIQTLEARLQESISDNYKRKFEELEAKVRRMERAQAAAAFTPPVTRAKARSHEALGASASTSVKRVRSTEGVTEASGSASRPRKVLRTSASTSKSARK